MKSSEKRQFRRFELNAPGLIECFLEAEAGGPTYLITRDLSGGGAYFHTKTPIAVETPLKVGIFLEVRKLGKLIEDGYVLIEASGLVKRMESGGMAVEFLERCKVQSL